MKKTLSVILMISLISCILVIGPISVGAATARDATLTTIDGKTIPVAPHSPSLINVVIFDYAGSYTSVRMIEEISSSMLSKVTQYRFIFAGIERDDQDVLEELAKKYQPDVTICQGNNSSLMWDLLPDLTKVYVPVTMFIDDTGTVRDITDSYLSVDSIDGKIKSILGDRYIEPPKDPNYTTATVVGSYYANIREALDRVNEIRYEACSEGVENPDSETGAPLTLSDYHPLVWCSDLEKITRLRAAESAICINHTRPNEKRCFTANTFSQATLLAENLAWNSSKDMVYGIDQFYEEKTDWVEKTDGFTGHYTSMISPAFYSIGIGGFYSDCGVFRSSLCMWLSDAQTGFDQTFGKPTDNVSVSFEVANRYLSDPVLSGPETMNSGESADLSMKANTSIDGDRAYVFLKEEVAWTSSDKNVLTVDNGKVTAVGEGTATITATDFSGLQASVTIRVKSSATEPPVTFILGDVDGDGKVMIFDASAIQQFIAGRVFENSFNTAAADVDGDGKITIYDASVIQRYLAGNPNYPQIAAEIKI